MPHHVFDTTSPAEIVVELGNCRIDLTCADTAAVEVTVSAERPDPDAETHAEQVAVDFDGARLTVRSPRRWWAPAPRLAVVVTAPAESRLAARCGISDVTCRGRAGELSVNAASGGVTAESVTGDVSINLGNGDIGLGAVGGRLRARRANGRLTVTSAMEVEADAANGETRLGAVAGRVRARTANGDLRIDEVSSGEVTVQTMSGNVDVLVRPGTQVKLDLSSHSGDVRSDLAVGEAPPPTGTTLELRVRTMTGDIRVGRAATATG